MLVEILLTFVFFVILYLFNQRRPSKFPPGPYGSLPLLGHLHLLGKSANKTIMKWGEKYGPIIGLNFGNYRAVAINDYALIKEILNENSTTGRPHFGPMTKLSDDGKIYGIIFADGSDWSEQRRFSMRHLKDFGFGKASMEELILEEVGELMEIIAKKNGQSISIKNLFNGAVLNALWRITTGNRFKLDDPKLVECVNRLGSSLPDSSSITFLSFFIPLMRNLPILKNIGEFENNVRDLKENVNFLKNTTEEHLATHQEGDSRDFLDVYINEIKRTTDKNSSFYNGEKSIIFTLFDLFNAGTETTSTALSWLVLVLAAEHPEIQEKMQNEIDTQIGKSRLPSLSDRQFTPYCEAILHEILRYKTIVPLSLFHKTLTDIEFKGYKIPKNTIIIPNLYAVHNDPMWGDPENFRPERFISPDGKFIKPTTHYVPFSIGKRFCLGQKLAEEEFYLFATGLFQKFKISIDPEHPPTFEEVFSAVAYPKPFNIIFQDRTN